MILHLSWSDISLKDYLNAFNSVGVKKEEKYLFHYKQWYCDRNIWFFIEGLIDAVNNTTGKKKQK